MLEKIPDYIGSKLDFTEVASEAEQSQENQESVQVHDANDLNSLKSRKKSASMKKKTPARKRKSDGTKKIPVNPGATINTPEESTEQPANDPKEVSEVLSADQPDSRNVVSSLKSLGGNKRKKPVKKVNGRKKAEPEKPTILDEPEAVDSKSVSAVPPEKETMEIDIAPSETKSIQSIKAANPIESATNDQQREKIFEDEAIERRKYVENLRSETQAFLSKLKQERLERQRSRDLK